MFSTAWSGSIYPALSDHGVYEWYQPDIKGFKAYPILERALEGHWVHIIKWVF
jgi:hypothetical protein